MRVRIDVALLYRVWRSEMSNAEAMKALGVTRAQFYTLGQLHKLGRRVHVQASKARLGREEPEITEDEFEARKAEVQARWTPEERERRIVGPARRAWRPPAFAFNGRVCAFADSALD